MSTTSATVETLTAEVRVLMVGNRQVTLSVYRQLDEVPASEIDPFGRVQDSADGKRGKGIYVIGRSKDGSLVRARIGDPETAYSWSNEIYPDCGDPSSFIVGPPGRLPDGTFRSRAMQALVASRHIPGAGRFDHVMEISYKAPQDSSMHPGTWRYATAQIETELTDEASAFLDDIEEEYAGYARWKALPLIVLAGLR